MQRVAHFRDVLRLGRVIAIDRIAHHSIASADRKHDLREIGRERDHPIDMRGQRHVAARIICQLLNC